MTNIPGGASSVASGEQVLSYMPPSPPKGNHRYVFSAFEQPHGSLSVQPPLQRGKFYTRDWANEYQCKLVGAAFFRAHA